MMKAERETRETQIQRETGLRARKLRIVFWLLAVVWMAVIFWLSASPDGRGNFWLLNYIPFRDKGAHALAFGFLAVLLYFASRRFWLAFLLTSLYGVSDEIHQYFTPGRSVDITDWVADTVGAALALAVLWVVSRARAGRTQQSKK
jgi:VanZ family protein